MRNGYVYRLSPWTTSSLSALSGANDERRLPCDMTTESLACPYSVDLGYKTKEVQTS